MHQTKNILNPQDIEYLFKSYSGGRSDKIDEEITNDLNKYAQEGYTIAHQNYTSTQRYVYIYITLVRNKNT